MRLFVTEYDFEGNAKTVLEMVDIPETDVTIEVGDLGLLISGLDSEIADVAHELGTPVYGALSTVLWKDAVTLYQEYE